MTTTKKIILPIKVIINYLPIIPSDRLAVGAPSSGIFSKIFLCCIETSQIAYLTKSTWSSTASVQVNNILLIFDFAHTNIQSILTDFNSIHPNLHFTAETEHNIQAPVYRKLTFTDTVIPYTSKHPFQHKYAAIRYLHNILHTYQLHNEEYNHEINFTHNILYNTSFPIQPLRPPKTNMNKQYTQKYLNINGPHWPIKARKLLTLLQFSNTPT